VPDKHRFCQISDQEISFFADIKTMVSSALNDLIKGVLQDAAPVVGAPKATTVYDRITDERLRSVVERIKSAALPFEKKVQLLRTVWNIARASSAGKGDTVSPPSLEPKAASQLMGMIADEEMRAAEEGRIAQKRGDDRRFDGQVQRLVEEDEHMMEQARLAAEAADAAKQARQIEQASSDPSRLDVFA
jgi:hypothetical protein